MLAYLITTTIYSGCAGSDDSKNAWAVLISHAHDQDVLLSTGQPLLLAWRIDLQAVLAKAERSGMDSSRTQTEALTFALVVDGELESMQHLSPSAGGELVFRLYVETLDGAAGGGAKEGMRIHLQLAIVGPNGPVGQITDTVELLVYAEDWGELGTPTVQLGDSLGWGDHGAIRGSQNVYGALRGPQDMTDNMRVPHHSTELWYSDACQLAHVDSTAHFSANKKSRISLPRTVVLEDFCPGGRGHANEVVVVPQLSLIYVTTRKVASSRIQDVLQRVYGADRKICAGKSHECSRFADERCTSMCLTETEIQNSFVFAVVRDPVERFYSSLSQAEKGWEFNFTLDDAVDTLEAMQSGKCGHELHFETQARVLSTPILDGRRSIPIDFIVRMENLVDDFLEMLRVAEVRTGKSTSHTEFTMIQDMLATKSNQRRNSWPFRTRELDTMVGWAFHQDVACFGRVSNDAKLIGKQPSLLMRSPFATPEKKGAVAGGTVPTWATLLSHVPGQTVYLRTDQPLILSWRIDLNAVEAEIEEAHEQGAGMRFRAVELAFVLSLDHTQWAFERMRADGSGVVTFQLLDLASEMHLGALDGGSKLLQLTMAGPDGPVGRTVEIELAIHLWDLTPEVSKDAERKETDFVSTSACDSGINQIIAFSDMKYQRAASEWYEKTQSLGYTAIRLIATDHEAFEKFVGAGYCAELELTDITDLSKLWRLRLKVLQRKLEGGYNILLSDIDTIFLRNVPLSEIAESGTHVAFMEGTIWPQDVFDSQGFVVCPGMSWWSAETPHALSIVRRLRAKGPCSDLEIGGRVIREKGPGDRAVDHCDDQREINRVLLGSGIAWAVGQNGERKGHSAVTGLNVTVWGSTFAWRGSLRRDSCPNLSRIWVAHPLSDNNAESKERSFIEWRQKCADDLVSIDKVSGTGLVNENSEIRLHSWRRARARGEPSCSHQTASPVAAL